QDALLSALVKLDQYDPRRPFGPWLLRIVANAATDRRRRRTVRRVEQLDPALVAGGARPDATTERRALSARLRAALAELSHRRRRLLGPGAGPLGPRGGGRSRALLAGGGVSRGPRDGGARSVGRGSADRAPHAGGRGGPGLRAGQLERKLRDAEPSYRVGHAA